MTDNEKLIEEARVAFTEAWDAEDRRIENWDRDARGTHSRSRAGIRAALAVFQKARTPTDDEREALGAAWDDGNAVGLDGWVGPGRGTEPVDDHAIQKREETVAKLAAGFRRSEVPEPSTAPKHDESCGERCNHCQVCGEHILYGSRCQEHPNRSEPQGEPSDALRDAIDHIQGAVEFQDAINPEAVRVVIDAALCAAGGVR